MNFQNNRYTLKFADISDDAGIGEVFESGSFPGRLEVKFLRGPEYFHSFQADGDEVKMMVILDNEEKRTVAVGGAVCRQEYVNGREETCAYLTGLKIHSDYQKQISFIARSYQFLHQGIADCSFCYTTILDENAKAIALLEKAHKNMPRYNYLGHYTTYCFHNGKSILKLEKDQIEGFEQLMDTYFSKHSLTPVNYNYAGFGDKTFYAYRENGEIKACCFVGNQQQYKRYKLCSYGGIYKTLQKLPTRLFGYPAFPQPDSIIDHGVLSYLYVQDHDTRLCRDFLRSVAADAGYSLLIWGGFENHPLSGALDQMKTVRYGSRLYSVSWEDAPEITGVMGMEAALL